MVHDYANEQPTGFKNRIENVAIVGAGGQCGKFIVEEMLKTGKHKITAITRAGSSNKMPDGVKVATVDYDDQSSLVEALKGQDALVITMGVTAPPQQQSKLFEAAATANVKWILPSEFGVDKIDDQVGKDIIIGPVTRKHRDYIETLGKSSWIGIACGFWYEFSLAGGSDRFGFDIKERTLTLFDDGTTRLCTSTWPQTGRCVANLLGLKVLPEDKNDRSVCLADFQNEFVRVSSFTLNQKEMFDSVLRVTGEKESDWKVNQLPVKEIYQEGWQRFHNGDRSAFGKLLYSRMFFPDNVGNFEASKGLDNDKLGLPKEDLDEFTKEAIHLAETGYFDERYG